MSSGARALLVLAGLLALASCADPEPDPEPESSTPRSVLLVTLDTVRADRLSCYGGPAGATPRIDALAAKGTRFEHCSTTTPVTLPSHTSLLTGEYPPDHGVRVNGLHRLPEAADTLAERFADAGAATAAFVSATVLERSRGLAQGFELYDDEVGPVEGSSHPLRVAADTVQRFEQWLADHDPAQPFFAWVHFYDPHLPWDPPDELRERFTPYVAEIHETDRATGRLLDALERRGLLQDTVVCVTADHGESLGEHGEQAHGIFVYESVLRVPLVFAGPDVKARVVSQRVGHVDVTATLSSLAGLEPLGVGRDLAPLLRGDAEELDDRAVYLETYTPYVSHSWSPSEAWIEDGYKLIDAPRPELYDLRADTAEQRDLFPEQSERASRMRAALQDFRADRSRALAADHQPVDPAMLEQLAALGYTVTNTEDAADLPPPGPEAGPDAKDRIHLLDTLDRMVMAAVRGNGDEALQLGRRILAEEPDNPTALQAVGVELCRRGSYRDAIELLSKLESSGRSTGTSLLSLGVALLNVDELEQADRALTRAEELEPKNPRVLRWLADVKAQRGDKPGAIERYERLLENEELPPDARRFVEGKLRALREN